MPEFKPEEILAEAVRQSHKIKPLDGGPAFPREDYQTNGYAEDNAGAGQAGITLRQYYAAKAMAALIGAYLGDKTAPIIKPHIITEAAFGIADAMIAAEAKS
ncbi:MAG: hypothetical protein JO253_03080 [Alphaproteobacteria bacterium]|nr:hypothetical protein [Alphaproteobacteria bacterium]